QCSFDNSHVNSFRSFARLKYGQGSGAQRHLALNSVSSELAWRRRIDHKIHVEYILWPFMTQDRFTNITEGSIATLINAFYAQVRRHPALGPIFEAAITEDEWPEHLETMQRFWSSVMLTSGRYSGNPVAVHRAVAGIERPLFADWLALFTQTAFEV